MANILSLEDVRVALRRAGKSQLSLAAELATELGVNEATVIQVLSGRLRGRRGDARKVALRLGLAEEAETALDAIDQARAAANAGCA